MSSKAAKDFDNIDAITDDYVKAQIDERLLGLYEHLIEKGVDVRKHSIHSWQTSDWNGKDYTNKRQVFSASFNQLYKYLDSKNTKLFVEVTSGKHKGSIGYISSTSWSGGSIIRINEKGDCTSALSAKAMRFLPNHDGTFRKAVKARVIKDIFDQVIEPDSKVIFAEKGKLRIGVMLEYDFHTNIALIRTPEGKVSVNPRKSQIVNCEKINSTFIQNTVLITMLRSPI